VPSTKEGKKGRKIGRNKRSPGDQKRIARKTGNKAHRKKKFTRPDPGFCLDSVNARVPEHRGMPLAHFPLITRPHVCTELIELSVVSPDSALGVKYRDQAECQSRFLKEELSDRVCTPDPEAIKQSQVKRVYL
jgi:hypothetical protein